MPNHGKPGFTVICENCSHEFFQPASRLDTKTLTPCPECGFQGNLEPDEWAAIEAKFAEVARAVREAFDQIKWPKGWRKR